MSRSRWRIMPPLPAGHAFAATYTPLMAQLLFNRGLDHPAKAEAFFNVDKRLCGDPWQMPDIDKAVQRIQTAILGGEQIAVYGDFDVDGISATAVLVKGLENLGGRVIPYIPHRLHEGHGLNNAAIAELKKRGATLLITVDCGITGVEQKHSAHSSHKPHMDLIITDHHIPPDELPEAIALVDPKLHGARYPFKELAGVGVGYKVLQALYHGLGKESEAEQFLDLVALGTIADMMPLTDENRYLVKAGLKLLKNTTRPGLLELAALSSINMEKLDTQDISFGLAPRLNAAGRMGHAISAYELLVTDSHEKARLLAAEMVAQNSERQRLTSEAIIRAREQVSPRDITPLLFIHDESGARGIIGLVAGRICEEYYHPTVVVQTGKHMCYGSCRSIPEFNITEAISQCSDLLTRFGGHAQAAGFAISSENLPRFEERLHEIAAKQLDGLDLRPQIDIDATLNLREISRETFEQIHTFEPFGMGNPKPVFLSRGVNVVHSRNMGIGGVHLRLKLAHGDIMWDAVAFGMGGRSGEMQELLDIVYNLELDEWNGESRLRLNIVDFAPAESSLFMGDV